MRYGFRKLQTINSPVVRRKYTNMNRLSVPRNPTVSDVKMALVRIA